MMELFTNLSENLTQAPLTQSQTAMYLDCLKRPNTMEYNIPLHLPFSKTQVTGETLEKILHQVCSNHPALFASIQNTPEGILMKQGEIRPITQRITLTEGEFAQKKASFQTPFTLSEAPLARCFLCETEENLHLLMEVHHIVLDGTGVQILCQEISGALAGKPLTPETISPFQLHEVEQRERKTPEFQASKDYYEGLLSGLELDSSLLTDEESQDPEGCFQKETFILPVEDPALVSGIKAMAETEKVSESSIFMTAFSYTLAKMTGQNESLMMVGTHGRGHAPLKHCLSFLVKILPVHGKFDETLPALPQIQQMQGQFYQSLKNSRYPFLDMVKEFSLQSETSFVYQGSSLTGVETEQGLVPLEVMSNCHINEKIVCHVYEKATGYDIRLEYQKALYHASTIARLCRVYLSVLDGFVKNIPLGEISLVSEADLTQFDRWNETQKDYDAHKTVVDAFAEMVVQYPDKVAVVFQQEQLTYQELDRLTDKVAQYLTDLSLKQGDIVSVLIDRNQFMPICGLGVLKAGLTYQPLDPTYPPDRLAFMMEDAQTALLIAQEDLLSLLPEYEGKVLKTTEISALPEKTSEFSQPKPEDIFVLLYTSGSTGVPKGCQLKHSNLTAFVAADCHNLEIDHRAKMSSYASFGFDASLLELYVCLSVGATLYVIPNEMRLDLEAMVDYIQKNKLTHAFMTTQVGRQFVSYTPETPDLKYLLTGGEALSGVVSQGATKLVNAYGPTETICYVTSLHVDRPYRNIPIGTPHQNVKLYVVDGQGRRLPVGAPGELLVGGPQVGAGYRNRPEKTAEVFIPNPYSQEKDYQTLYRTGDIVRYLEDGNIEFVGRRDAQVKLNGFRVEIPEVEAVIKEYPSITDVTVQVKTRADGGKMLHAYVVSPEKVDINHLNAFILERKPPYLVPSATMQLDSIPLNQNFKVDKKKLPEIQGETAEETRNEPTRLEKELKELVSSIIGNENMGLSTPLGLLGLSSISAMKLAGILVKTYGYSPDVMELSKKHSILTLEDGIVSHLLRQSKGETEVLPTTTATEGYALSQSQLGIYLESQTAEGMATYNMPLLVKLPQTIQIERLKSAIVQAISAHPSLLCVIQPDREGNPKMYPRPERKVEILEKTWKNTESNPEETKFSFGDSPLFAVTLLNTATDWHLLLELHHVIGDGESLTLLLRDIHRAYGGETLEQEAYTAFFFGEDEAKKRENPAFSEAKAYYDGVFQGVSVDVLPKGDRVDAPSVAKKISHHIPLEESGISGFCEAHGYSENLFFTSVLGILLGKYSASDEAIFNVIHNGRTDPRSLETVGMFVKTMPVYCNLQPETTIAQFFSTMDTHLTQLKVHGIYSYGEISRAYGISNDILLAYQGEMLSNMTFCGAPLSTIEMTREGNKAPLNLDVFKKSEGFSLELEYDSGRYSQAFVQSFLEALEICATSLTKAKKLDDIVILSPTGEETLKKIHDTAVDVTYQPVYALLQQTAKKYPHRLAVVADGETLTYEELNSLANGIGHKLQGLGVGVDDVVALILDRTKYVYMARQGILKSGAGFLSVDPTYPPDRVEFMLADAKTKAVLLTRDIYEKQGAFLDSLGLPLVFLDEMGEDYDHSDLNVAVPAEALAYCIYTSGSTGKPKGVMLTQGNLVNFVDNNPKNHEVLGYIQRGKVSLALASIAFDVSIMEEFIPLSHGLTICMATLEEIHNPLALRDLCLEHKVDIMSCTPSFMSNMVDMPEMVDCIAQLKSVDFGAEAFPAALFQSLKKLNPDLYIMNGYGPTEATVSCTMEVITQDKQITIGIPNSNVKVVIVDEKNRLLPVGALGEMVILGDGVGRGYVNRPDLTEKVFTQIWGMKAYKSGDFARILPDGRIEFRGRVDNQVKLRGLRVELGEIETAINSFSGIKSAMVLMKESTSGAYLAGYFTAEQTIDQTALVAHLSATLTPYMVPSVWVQLEAFPLTANGKINKTALPEPNYQVKQTEYVAPANEIEEALCKQMAKILKLEQVSATDNFFELGGTSLSASKLAMFAMSQNYALVYGDIFLNPSPQAMAKLCLGSGKTEGSTENTLKNTLKNTPENTLEQKEFPALGCNKSQYVDEITRNSLGDVVLTGATGFLGVHILKHFLAQEEGKIYCFMRKGKSATAENRLKNILAYYFEDPMEELMGKRIFCVEGSITDKESMEQLEKIPFQTLINCAAVVKHFAFDDSLTKTNVTGVENLISLCLSQKKRLIQLSTVSVGGEARVDQVPQDTLLLEHQLFLGQTVDNAYIRTKYQGEQAMLNAIEAGLDGKIMRVGNLMPRETDGEFQINSRTNGFMRELRGYQVLGKFPVTLMGREVEFSPIDATAEAVLLLSGTDSKFTVFHPYNNHKIFMGDVIDSMNHHGLPIDVVPFQAFNEEMTKALEDSEKNQGVSGLIVYCDHENGAKFMVDCDNKFTMEALYRLQFNWPISGKSYLEKSLTALDKVGFFDFN